MQEGKLCWLPECVRHVTSMSWKLLTRQINCFIEANPASVHLSLFQGLLRVRMILASTLWGSPRTGATTAPSVSSSGGGQWAMWGIMLRANTSPTHSPIPALTVGMCSAQGRLLRDTDREYTPVSPTNNTLCTDSLMWPDASAFMMIVVCVSRWDHVSWGFVSVSCGQHGRNIRLWTLQFHKAADNPGEYSPTHWKQTLPRHVLLSLSRVFCCAWN